MTEHVYTQSAFQLLRKLTHGEWSTAYEALIDLTGEFRKDSIREIVDHDALLHTTTLSLHVNGHTQDADRINSIANLLDKDNKYGPLSVLFLLARKQKKPSSIVPRSLFGHDKIDAELIPDSSNQVKLFNPPGSLFHAPLGFDDMRVFKGKGKFSSSPEIERKVMSQDCIGSGAAFAAEQNEIWFKMKIEDMNDQQFTNNDESPSEPVNLFREFVRKRCRKQSKSIIVTSNISNDTLDQAFKRYSNDDTLVQHILSKCLLGNDPDEMMLRREDGVPRTRLMRLICQEEDISVEHRRFFANRQARVFLRMKAADFLNISERTEDRVTDLIARANASGTIYQDILSFAEAYGSFSRGRALRAVTDFTYEICRDYFTCLLSSIEDTEISSNNTPLELLNVSESYMADFLILASILSSFEKTDGSACSLINIAVNAARERSANEMIHTVLIRIVSTYTEVIWDWFFEGSSVGDTRKECFGTVLGASVSGSELLSNETNLQYYMDTEVGVYPDILNYEDALFLLRAGRSRSLLRLFEIHDEVGSHRKYLANVTMDHLFDYTTTTLPLRGRPTHNQRIQKEDKEIARDDEQKKSMLTPAVYSYFTEKSVQREHTLSSDDNLSPFRIQDINMTQSLRDKCDSTKLFTRTLGSTEKQETEAKIDLGLHFRRSKRKHLPEDILTATVIPYLRSIDISVQRRILDCYVQKLQLFDHLRNLQAHALLGAGDFAIILVELIVETARVSEANERYMEKRAKVASTTATFYGASGTINRRTRDRTRLQRCFRTAINLHTSYTDVLTDLMSLDAKPKDPNGNPANSIWDYAMSLRYDVGFPLDVIMSENAMSCYSKIFQFFLRILRAKQSLRSMYMLSRRNSVLRFTNGSHSLQNRQLQVRLWHFCYHAEHFVSIFGVFEMEQVLGSAWDSFQSSWESTGSIWELRDLHTQFLEDSIRRCLLSEKHSNVLNVMTGGFDIVVTVDMELQKLLAQKTMQNQTAISGLTDLVGSATMSLKRRASFLIDVLERLLQSGSLPHLHDLLTRVNFNRYFEVIK